MLCKRRVEVRASSRETVTVYTFSPLNLCTKWFSVLFCGKTPADNAREEAVRLVWQQLGSLGQLDASHALNPDTGTLFPAVLFDFDGCLSQNNGGEPCPTVLQLWRDVHRLYMLNGSPIPLLVTARSPRARAFIIEWFAFYNAPMDDSLLGMRQNTVMTTRLSKRITRAKLEDRHDCRIAASIGDRAHDITSDEFLCKYIDSRAAHLVALVRTVLFGLFNPALYVVERTGYMGVVIPSARAWPLARKPEVPSKRDTGTLHGRLVKKDQARPNSSPHSHPQQPARRPACSPLRQLAAAWRRSRESHPPPIRPPSLPESWLANAFSDAAGDPELGWKLACDAQCEYADASAERSRPQTPRLKRSVHWSAHLVEHEAHEAHEADMVETTHFVATTLDMAEAPSCNPAGEAGAVAGATAQLAAPCSVEIAIALARPELWPPQQPHLTEQRPAADSLEDDHICRV